MLRQSERDRIIELTREGRSRKEVAKEIGCTADTVRNVLRDAGMADLLNEKRVEGGRKGFNNRVILESGFGNA